MTRRNDKHQVNLQVLLWSELKHAKTDKLIQLLGDRRTQIRIAAARELNIRGGKKVFERAKNLCHSDKAMLRESGALVLAQLGTPKFPFARQSEPILARLALCDPSASVRGEAVAGLGHLARTESFETLRKCIGDKSWGVRATVAFALGRQGRKAVSPLLTLTQDKHSEVRNWAAFSLNQINVNTKEVRNIFFKLLRDNSEEVRREVIIGLARWRDSRVFTALKKELHKDEIFFDFIRAAGELGDKRLLPRLEQLRKEWDDTPRELQQAISRLKRSKP